ncbi:MAG TPA: O-antigen ligase family protein [Planctomycetota bacterium]
MPAPLDKFTGVISAAALVVICAAPMCYGCQPPWASGFLLAAILVLAAIQIPCSLLSGISWLAVPWALRLAAGLLVVWLWIVFAQHAPRWSSQLQIAYAVAFLAAASLGVRAGRATESFRKVLGALMLSALVLSGFALAEWAGWDVKQLAGFHGDPQRPSGLYTNANRFAVLLSVCWMCACALFLDLLRRREARSLSQRLWLVFSGLALAVISLSIALTLSRLTIIATAIALGLAATGWLIMRPKVLDEARVEESAVARMQRLTLLALPIMVICGWLIWCFMVGATQLHSRFVQIDLAENRLPVIRAALPLLSQQPWFGTGLGSFETRFTAVQPANLPGRWRELHCDWLQLAIEAGFPTLFFALALTATWLMACWRRIKAEAEESERLLRLLPAAGILVVLICSLGDFPLREPATAMLVFFLAGALCAGRPRDGETGRRGDGGQRRAADAGESWEAGGERAGNGQEAAGALQWRVLSLRRLVRAVLTTATAVVLLVIAFVVGRNSAAYAVSPWAGLIYSPPSGMQNLDGWQRAVQFDGRDPELRFRLAAAALATSAQDRSRLDLARVHIRAATEMQPRDYRFPWLQASICEQSGEMAQATDLRELATQLFPNNPSLREQNGRFYLKAGVLNNAPGEPLRQWGLKRAAESFRCVLASAPAREPELIQTMEMAGCLSSDIVALWPGDEPEPRLRRARFYCERGQWDLADRELPAAAPESMGGRRWLHSVRGALYFQRAEPENGLREWTQALSLSGREEREAVDGWLAERSGALDPPICESLAGAVLPELIKYPLLAGVLAKKMISSHRYAVADSILEPLASRSPDLGAQWAELALASGDVAVAESRARRVWDRERFSEQWKTWYKDFEARVSKMSAQRVPER